MSVVFSDGFGGQTVQENVQVVLGGAVALLCDVPYTNPPPEIQWFNSAGQIVEIVGDVVLEENGRYLFLATLTAQRLQDSYRCQVTNVRLTETIISSTLYSLSDDLPEREPLVYKEIGDLVGRSGDTLESRYVVGYRSSDSGNVGITILCRLEDRNGVLPNAGLRVAVPVPKPVGSKNILTITCIVVSFSDGAIGMAEGSLTIVGK